MTTTGWSESINAYIKRFIGSRTTLKDFVKQVDIAIDDIEQNQSSDTMLDTYRSSSLRTLSPLENQAHNALTPYSFKMFQEEFAMATQYSIPQEHERTFFVQHYKEASSQKHKVNWDGKFATCSCKQFEFSGILCRHVLSVFLHKDCYEIPQMYLPMKWHRQAMQMDNTPHVEEQVLEDRDLLLDDNTMTSQDDCINCPPI
ncbi:Zinc finger, PMZ-type [Corchorus capsularis]|uniref:Protein FAR1-RELATED SEQUENCE n=1 Tax=Corchorus capsularis TaxID=210143 RepID=A0A1R3HBZ9_COCAP|nr:Zinc finger, PMZ-type [Corchorus capsularis]